MNSGNGTKNMEPSNANYSIDFKQSNSFLLSAKEICSIIQACNKNHVANFSYGDLCIKFQSQGPETAIQPGPAVDHLTSNEMVSHTDEISENEEAMLEAENGMLMVEDPLEFERLQVDRHIERERNAEA